METATVRACPRCWCVVGASSMASSAHPPATPTLGIFLCFPLLCALLARCTRVRAAHSPHHAHLALLPAILPFSLPLPWAAFPSAPAAAAAHQGLEPPQWTKCERGDLVWCPLLAVGAFQARDASQAQGRYGAVAADLLVSGLQYQCEAALLDSQGRVMKPLLRSRCHCSSAHPHLRYFFRQRMRAVPTPEERRGRRRAEARGAWRRRGRCRGVQWDRIWVGAGGGCCDGTRA